MSSSETPTILTWLEKFVDAPKIILDPKEAEKLDQVPASWLAVLKEQSKGIRGAWLDLWEPVLGKLPALEDFLTNVVLGVAILEAKDEELSLIYMLSTKDGYRCYRGSLPLTEIPSRLEEAWKAVPAALQELYKVHDGWGYFVGSGLLATKDMLFMSDADFGLDLLDDEISKLPCDIEKVISVFDLPSGDALCLDTGNVNDEGEAKSLLFLSDDQANPDYDLNFWKTLNEYLKADFKDAV